jgi:SP family sugar:H+ symporter-like MFS transporter
MSDTSTDKADNIVFIIFISCVATIGGFLFGFDSGVINGTVDGLQVAFNTDSIGTGFNVASMLLGSAVGAFMAGRLADFFGRKAVLILAAIFFLISAWGSGAADSSLAFIIYRIIGGLAVGAASIMAPAYISEIAPARIRGTLTTIQQIAIITGLFSAFLSNYFLAKVAGSAGSEFWFGFETWRWMFWVEIVPAAIFFLTLFFIPESPRYLVVSGNQEKASAVLKKLFGADQAKVKLAAIDNSLAEDHHRPALSDLLTPETKKVRTIVWVGIGLAVLQQLVGINVVFYYGAVLWQSVGFTESDALLINVISGAVSIIAVLVTLATIDRIGRKPFLVFGSVGMSVSLAAMVFAFATGTLNADGQLILSDGMGMLALVAANVYVFMFNSSWGPVMWIMLGEMFPNQIRGSGLAVSGMAQWGANFGITMTFPVLLAAIGLAGAYGIYMVFAIVSIIFTVVMVKETRGKELEDMVG